jgi:uncharacterized iron-regulated membrane protein
MNDNPHQPPNTWPDYRALWRWHFYASLFCIPFVILLSITGAIYLFKPQIDRFEERAYNDLELTGDRALASAQVRAAVAAVPGGLPMSLELPEQEGGATRVLVQQGAETKRVFVHPQTLAVLGSRADDATFIRWIRGLHGQLHLGTRGSNLVELAASWTVIMIVTGLCLWWPRSFKGWGGILYPRLTRSSRIFWRDLHSVTGFWICFTALFLLATGLPWAKFWGEYFRSARSLVTSVASQDWTIGGEEVLAADTGHGHHGHHGAASSAGTGTTRSGGGPRRGGPPMPESLEGLDRVVPTAVTLRLAHPVIITPPAAGSDLWTVKSEAQNRTLRTTCQVDGSTGRLVQRENFADRPLVDRLVAIGIAAHEGQLFGWLNQLIGLLTALGLVLLSVSGYVMWWRRRTTGLLGAPAVLQPPRFRWPLLVTVLLLAAYLPLFGLSLLVVLLIERWVLQKIPATRDWLGLSAPSPEVSSIPT